MSINEHEKDYNGNGKWKWKSVIQKTRIVKTLDNGRQGQEPIKVLAIDNKVLVWPGLVEKRKGRKVSVCHRKPQKIWSDW